MDSDLNALTILLNEIRRIKDKPSVDVTDRKARVCAVVAHLRLIAGELPRHLQ